MEINCDYCGKLYIYKGGEKHYKRTKHHYCSRACQANGNNIVLGNRLTGLAKKVNGKQDKRYRIWCNVKKRAKKSGIDFQLEVDDIPTIPAICPILGIEIKANDISSPLDSSPSLDRIDPKKGYVKDNIRIISNRANRIKSDATIDEIRLLLGDFEKREIAKARIEYAKKDVANPNIKKQAKQPNKVKDKDSPFEQLHLFK